MQLFTYRKGIGLFAALVVAGAVLACTSGAAPGVDAYADLGLPGDPVPFMEAARTGVLPNGLRYYILENAKPENRAYLTLAVQVGSVLEQEHERGLAHFVEHMAFNGTARFPKSELVEYLRSLGMRFGPEVNAYTSYDETVYGFEVPTETDETGRKRIPESALAVLDDWTHAISFEQEDVDAERLVIMEEYRSRLGASERIRRQILPVLFEGSPYADRSPIGLPEIIESVQSEQLRQFYKTWYRTDTMALIFVGDFDGAALEASLTGAFSTPAPETPLERSRYDLPPPEKSLRPAIFTDPELPYTQVYLYYKQTPQERRGDLAAYREGVVAYLVNSMLSLRFDEALSRPETPYIRAGAGSIRYGAASRFFIFTAHAKAGATAETLRALLEEKESLVRYGFTEGELKRAKGALVAYLTNSYAEQDRQESAGYVQAFTNHFLKDESVPDIGWELEAVKALLPGIQRSEIARAVKEYFAPQDLRVFVIAPEGEAAGLPSTQGIERMVAQARKARISRPVDQSLSDKLLDAEPQAGTVVAESVDIETGARCWELSNGAKVILKESQNRNNEIILYALARGGTSSAPEAEDWSARLAAEMLGLSGLGSYSRSELVKKLADKQVSLGFWASTLLRGFEGVTTAEDAKTFFELLYLTFTQPRMESQAVKAMLDQYRTILLQNQEDPATAFSQEVQRTRYQNHPRFSPMQVEDLAKVNQDDALSFIQDSLNPADYTFVFTGNLDIPTLRWYIETYLAAIPPGTSWNTWTDPRISRPGRISQTLYKGQEGQSRVYLGRYMPASYTEEEWAATAVLEAYLDIKLTEEIREKLGGVYTISGGVNLSFPPPQELRMEIFFGCDPKRVEELCAAIEGELHQIAQGAVDERTLTQAKAALKKSWEGAIQSNSYIAQSYANSAVIYGLPLSRLDKRPSLYEGVSAQEVQAIMQRLIPVEQAQVILYPEGWTP
jgi:zinc protease